MIRVKTNQADGGMNIEATLILNRSLSESGRCSKRRVAKLLRPAASGNSHAIKSAAEALRRARSVPAVPLWRHAQPLEILERNQDGQDQDNALITGR